ncbi:MAG TPA: hypothetical protein VGF44_02110 [Terriglobales bacterium]|jgi:DNA polymerase III gamma/tau subunit
MERTHHAQRTAPATIATAMNMTEALLKILGAFLTTLLLLAVIAAPSYAQDDKPKPDEPKAQEVKPSKEAAPKQEKAAKDQDKHAQDQEKHAQDQQMKDQQKDQQKAQENQAKDQQKQEQDQARHQQDQAKHQQDQQAKQQQDQARHEQNKQAQENQKQQQEQAKQQQKNQDKQAKDQQKARDDQARAQARNDNHNDNRGHVEHASQRQRIPDDRFRQHFGREHHFHPGHPRMVNNRPEFQDSGYTFEFVDAWPADWSYDDDCYIDYVDDGYYLFDPVHPGIRIALNVIF